MLQSLTFSIVMPRRAAWAGFTLAAEDVATFELEEQNAEVTKEEGGGMLSKVKAKRAAKSATKSQEKAKQKAMAVLLEWAIDA